jgi:hypothetical protein
VLSDVIFEEPSHVKAISGFEGCPSLSRITFPASVEMISGFAYCESLSDLTFERESHLKSISGFTMCSNLHWIVFPRSVETISDFCQCRSLREVIFDQQRLLRTLKAFRYCCWLSRVEIPASVESIRGSFKYCNSLREIAFALGSVINDIPDRDYYLKKLRRIEIPIGFQALELDFFRVREKYLWTRMTIDGWCLLKRRSDGHCMIDGGPSDVSISIIPGIVKNEDEMKTK